MIYCDTSLLVAALTDEQHTERARQWLSRHNDGKLAASLWVTTEIVSALAMKQRMGLLELEKRKAIEQAWQHLANASFMMLSIDARHFALASRLVDSGSRGLRAADALHLALAVDHRCEIVTFDRDLADAATAEGLMVHQ